MSEQAAGGKIGLLPCLAFSVGTMVGGGVFTLSGTAVNDAGPAAIVAYLLAGLIMLLSALSFVAVAARAEPGDSGYGPIGDLLGPAWRFLAMWGFYLNGLTILTFLMLSFGEYLNGYFLSGVGPILAAVVAAIAIVALNFGPTDAVARTETYVVALKIAIILLFVGWGIAEFSGSELRPFAPEGAGGLFQVTALLFTAYTGFNVVTNMAGAVRDPGRTIPIAVIGSVLISAALYVGVIVAMLMSGVESFGPDGVGEAATALMGDWGGTLIAFAACISTLSGANANVLGTSELALRLAAQGDVPPGVARIGPRGHPFVSLLFIAGVTVLLVLVADIDNIVALANVGALAAMIVVNMAAFRLALRGWPGHGLRLPGGPLIPAVGAVTCLLQFPSLGWREVLVGLGLLAAGLVLYRFRHRPEFGAGVAERAAESIANVATPLGRAMRHRPFG